MKNKELLDKWYGKKFKCYGRVYTCLGIDTECEELEPQVVYYNIKNAEYSAVDINKIEEVKEPRVIYLNEYNDGLSKTFFLTEREAKSRSGSTSQVKTIKFKEVIE